jgi:hypothetical protein
MPTCGDALLALAEIVDGLAPTTTLNISLSAGGNRPYISVQVIVRRRDDDPVPALAALADGLYAEIRTVCSDLHTSSDGSETTHVVVVAAWRGVNVRMVTVLYPELTDGHDLDVILAPLRALIPHEVLA